MMRSGRGSGRPLGVLLFAVLWVVSDLAGAEAPPELVWPTPAPVLEDGLPPADYVQPTAAGTTESALFGCVRNNGRRFHEAVDIAPALPRKRGRPTDPVVAIHDGIVRHISKDSWKSSYGRYVVLEHPLLVPAVYTLYSHLATLAADLEEGDAVRAGQQLGIMGNSAGGYRIPWSRAHLHLEVGLRVSNDFEDWYGRQSFGSPNHHGNFNGMNLVGLDPLQYFREFRPDRAGNALAVIESIAPAAKLHVRVGRRPDFLRRYPSLELEGCGEEVRVGWEVFVSGWGLPLSFRGLAASELRGAANGGEITVVAVDRGEMDRYACRNLLEREGPAWRLGSGGRQLLELLWLP